MIGTDISDSSHSMERMGQNVSRIMSKQQTKAQQEIVEIGLSNARIDNQMKQIELSNALKSQQPQSKSEAVSEQSFISPDVKKTPSEVVSSISNGAVQAGQNPAYRYYKSGKNEYQIALSPEFKQANEDSPREIVSEINLMLNQGKHAPRS